MRRMRRVGMGRRRWRGLCAVCLGAGLLTAARESAAQELFPARDSGGEWLVTPESRTGDVRVMPFLDRDALWLRNNTTAIRAGLTMVNGTIAFDVAPMAEADFFGVEFRREGFGANENVYFRPPSSGRMNALQYAPRVGGSSTWQLYPEFNRRIDLPRNAWTSVRMEIDGPLLEVFVSEDEEPVLRVERLRGGFGEGEVAFWARVNERDSVWAAAVSRIRITPRGAAPGPDGRVDPPEPGIVTDWEVAGPIDDFDGRTLPELDGWGAVEVEEGGLVNLNRILGRLPRDRRWTAFARTRVRTHADRPTRLEVGYSDDLTVFVDGAPVYSGRSGWESRWERYLGHVVLDAESIWLPPGEGTRDVVLAVGDDMLFGWGFRARVTPGPEVRSGGGGP